MNRIKIHYLFRESVFTIYSLSIIRFQSNPLSTTRSFYGFTIDFANSLWFHHLFREFTMNQISFSRFHQLFCEITMSWLSVSWIHYKSLTISRIYYEITWFYLKVFLIFKKKFSNLWTRFGRNFLGFFCVYYVVIPLPTKE